MSRHILSSLSGVATKQNQSTNLLSWLRLISKTSSGLYGINKMPAICLEQQILRIKRYVLTRLIEDRINILETFMSQRQHSKRSSLLYKFNLAMTGQILNTLDDIWKVVAVVFAHLLQIEFKIVLQELYVYLRTYTRVIR